ncbi:hypothetical protein DLM75_20405 [Leptospira stimsonii]|uniref:Uncharacterized protein n=1 Tax=Leptospira stimsonii TaxID=2202203 RepID=A0A396YQQ9_9LEPT|nr:hypothetical protein DLM75_20405 [Leptospira stimsonii]
MTEPSFVSRNRNVEYFLHFNESKLGEKTEKKKTDSNFRFGFTNYESLSERLRTRSRNQSK